MVFRHQIVSVNHDAKFQGINLIKHNMTFAGTRSDSNYPGPTANIYYVIEIVLEPL